LGRKRFFQAYFFYPSFIYALKKEISLKSYLKVSKNRLGLVFNWSSNIRFSFNDPCDKSKFYKKAVETADLEKLTKLIGICALLLQTKVYLFWG